MNGMAAKQLIPASLVGLGLGWLLVGGMTAFAASGYQAQAQDVEKQAIEPDTLRLPRDLPLLQPGVQGEAVQQLQMALTQLGWYQDSINGLYGATTEQAVRAFQQQEGLVADGIVGAETWQQLALSLHPQSIFGQLALLNANSLSFTLLNVAQPDPPPSPLWLLLMPAIPLLGGGLTYWQHQRQERRRRA